VDSAYLLPALPALSWTDRITSDDASASILAEQGRYDSGGRPWTDVDRANPAEKRKVQQFNPPVDSDGWPCTGGKAL
jgi:hypothetical protein